MTATILHFLRRHGALLCLGLVLAACETTAPTRGPVSGGDPTVIEPGSGAVPGELATIPQQRSDEIIRVAVILPFTHESENVSTVAAAMLKAAQMVAFESQNARYVLVPKDDKGTLEGARIAATEAVREGAEIVLGPLFSESVTVVADVVRPYRIPVIAFSSDSEVAGNGVYLLSFPPEEEISRVTEYALSKGYARFGLMAPFSEFGDRVARSFASEVYQAGGDLVHTERYERSPDAMIEPARRMAKYAVKSFVPSYRSARPVDVDAQLSAGATAVLGEGATPVGNGAGGGYQAVLLPEQGRLLRALAPLFPYYNVNVREVKLLGLSAWNNPLLTREPALNGGWFAAPDPALAEGFERRYQRAYGEAPPRLASLAYDAALLTAKLSELPPRERFSPARIANPNGYLGADGLFRLRSDGMVERGLAVLEIRTNGIVVIDPAPRSFVGADTGAAGY